MPSMKSTLILALGTVNGLIHKHFEGTSDVKWDSLVINRRKPHTYRAFCYPKGDLEGIRICLHRFEPCSDNEAFLHPHPWPSAMRVLKGEYRMRVGFSPWRERPTVVVEPTMVMDTILAAGSSYVMEEPMAWHSVQPITTCWSVMVNGAPWGDKAHPAAPTTKGKDLEKMSPDDLDNHLRTVQVMLSQAMDPAAQDHGALVLAALDKRAGSAPALEIAALADLTPTELDVALKDLAVQGQVRIINEKKPLYEQVVVRRRA